MLYQLSYSREIASDRYHFRGPVGKRGIKVSAGLKLITARAPSGP